MQHLEQQLDAPSKIESTLFLSGASMLSDKTNLENYDISYVVNLSDQQKVKFDQINFLSIAIADNVNTDISAHFRDFFIFMQKASKEEKNVLVCCQYGMSRSVSFVIAWLMQKQHQQGEIVSYAETLKQVKSKRPMASPNEGFAKQLINFENTLNKQLNKPSYLEECPDDISIEIISKLEAISLEKLSLTTNLFSERFKKNKEMTWKKFLLNDFNIHIEDIEKHINAKKLSAQFIYSRLSNGIIPTPYFFSVPILIGYLGEEDDIDAYLKNNPKDEFSLVSGLIYANKINIIKSLHDNKKININLLDKNNQNYLFIATYAKRMEIFKHLITLINPTQVNKQGNNLLHISAMHGNVEAFEYLQKISTLTLSDTNNMGYNVLHLSASFGHENIVKNIIDKNVLDVNILINAGLAAIDLANKKGHIKIVSILDEIKPKYNFGC